MKLDVRALMIGLGVFMSSLAAQKLDPVQWTLTSDVSKAPPGSTVPLRLTAKLDPGWHLYSLTTPAGGPIPTTAVLADNPSVEKVILYQPKPERKLDPNFGVDTETFLNEAAFWVTAELKKDAPAGAVELEAQVRYQTCDDRRCLPPRKKTAQFTLNVDGSAAVPAALVAPAGYTAIQPGVPLPVLQQAPPVPKQSDGLTSFLLGAFGLGLASIFTPCVFPMIPVTVSFFLNQRGGIAQAAVFSLGIVVLFCAMGLGVTAAIGPFGVVQLGSNPWVNGFIAVVFCAFALSLLGAFEITLPSGLLTKLDQASRKGGYAGTLLMGFTFALTSFACVGPFVGSLLAASVQTKGLQPTLGMASFAGGLSAPFFFLAAFPSYLKKLPRNGGWLMRVKVVMGFVLLAAMLKYVSNIDQVLQTNFLTRERFLAAWLVLFALPGLYLLGLLRLEGVEAGERLGIPRLLTASLFLIFSFSLLPGMFGVPLGELEAYVPAAPASLTGSSESGIAFMKNQYHEALAKAKEEHKLVLVTFTGYACTNCHWMKANLFPKPEIAAELKDLVLVDLYTDGTDAASEENQKLEDSKFQTVAIPYYALMDGDEKVVSTFPGSTRDANEFLAFLKTRAGA
jgi:thiol:disulfide interchange protein DsbD